MEFLDVWKDTALDLARNHAQWIGVIVFLLGLGESIALVSLFVPSTFLFLGLGAIDSAAGGSFWPNWLAGAAGACLGDCISFALGRYFRDDVGKIWPLSRFPDLIPQGRALFDQWGALSIVGGKFIGGLRPFIPVAAGVVGMGWPLFVLASAVSSLLWAGVFLAPGYGLSLVFK